MMARKLFRVPFHRGHVDFALPQGMCGRAVRNRPFEPVSDIKQAVATALAQPVNSPPLRKLANKGATVCVVFTDITRDTPDNLLVPALLQELLAAGVRQKDITLLCGTGMHRPSTAEEKAAKLGDEVVAHYRVVDNAPEDPEMMVDLGCCKNGVPVVIHRAVVEADLVVASGAVEPHQYAGYSGGAKTVAIGAAGKSLIAAT
ncbi:MAG: DUF2088 domain-containing protein, partial [Deltaproteobacteria bacterium]|nr:DUF2088 domain-containing protein [Deltaproteobacteria bacterium]